MLATELNPSLEKRAETGEPRAIYELAKAYYHGKGVSKNREKAVFYYKRLAKFHPKEIDFIGYGTLLAFLGKLAYNDRKIEEALYWYDYAMNYIRGVYTETFAQEVIEDITLEQCIEEAKAALEAMAFS